MSRLRRLMASGVAIMLVGLAAVIWTWLTLGWDVAWRLAMILAGLGAVDALLGMTSKALSWEVNRGWHRDPRRYWYWLAGVAVALWLLHLHFTGV